MSGPLRSIPSVDRLLRALGDCGLPRPIVADAVRRRLAAIRDAGDSIEPDAIAAAIRLELELLRRKRLLPVINATGVVLHTNLGRAPLSTEAVDAVTRVAAGYSNLEFALDAGERGSRGAYVERALAALCGAEAATLVNNCAAALVLILHALRTSTRDRVVISRGELIQIGGGFRVPEILEASGATLREVGTTNRTTAEDYRGAIDERTAIILRVHRSNFYVGGFVEDAASADLAALARDVGVPFVEDLGSGATFDTADLDTDREPTPRAALASGATLVCFSGDKLLGGPQAGVIAGSAAHVAACKRHPMFRAFRCDKLAIAAMEATVDAHLRGAAVPAHAMLREPIEMLRGRAERIVAALAGSPLRVSVGVGESTSGGGTMPKLKIESATLDVESSEAGALAARLRGRPLPIVGYVSAGRLRLDLRTVFPAQDAELVSALRELSGSS